MPESKLKHIVRTYDAADLNIQNITNLVLPDKAHKIEFEYFPHNGIGSIYFKNNKNESVGESIKTYPLLELERLEESLTNGFVIKSTKEHKGTLD